MPQIVVELGAAHNGKLSNALALVDAAARAGADAVKIQCWHPDRMVLDQGYVLPSGPWAGRNLYELYRQCHTPWAWIPKIAERAAKHGIEWFSSVFDGMALAELERQHCPRYKIASCEIVDLPLIEAVARTDKPIVISTGMATYREIADAVAAAGRAPVTLLQCTAAYPASVEHSHLRTMAYLAEQWPVTVGLSDHTLGSTAAIVATVLGATMIEKHLTLDRDGGGPDDGFATTEYELAALVRDCKEAGAALGRIHHGPKPGEEHTLGLRRSLYYARDMKPGEAIGPADLVSARPALGVHPATRRVGVTPVARRRGEPVQ